MEKSQSRRESVVFSHELHKKYADLPGSSEVNRTIARDRAARVDDVRYREPKSKEDRIDAYFQFLEDRFASDDLLVMGEEGDEHAGVILEIRDQEPLQNEAFQKLKRDLLGRYTMQIGDDATLTRIAEGLYASEKKLAVARGMGAQIPALEGKRTEVVARYKALILEKHDIQKKTLASWLEYLQQNDAKQPMWFRYLVLRSLGKMGLLDKERLDYSKRTADTIAPFPELNSEALAWVYSQMLQFKEQGVDFPPTYLVPDAETQKKKDQVLNAVRSKDFAKLYAFAQVETVGRLDRESLVGEWKKYPQGSDPVLLERDIKGKGTGWCTAEGSARDQLEAGDFYVYFTQNKTGQATEPRIAIRMEGGQVAEVRGVDKQQGIEPALLETAKELYSTLPGGDKYDKKNADMKRMSALVQQEKNGESFSREDLLFLYEINAPIEGFGYNDPRIAELRGRRNPQEDMLIVFECDESQLARSVDQINESTKVYVGKFEPGILDRLPEDFVNLYTKFPEGRIRRQSIEIGGKDEYELEEILTRNGHQIETLAKSMMEHDDFKRSLREPDIEQSDWKKWKIKSPEEVKLIRLRVEDLGLHGFPKTEQVFARAQELGLELCPPEIGPQFRLRYTDQPTDERVYIGMRQIFLSDGDPRIFLVVARDNGKSLLDDSGADSTDSWEMRDEFVFRFRK